MHYNTLFQDINLKKVSGAGHSPSLDGDPSPLGRETPPGPNPTPSAPTARRSSRLRRSTPRAFGARFYASSIFNADCLATLTVTNVVQGKRSQW